MSQYRIFQSTASWISRILIFLLGFMLLVITAESIRIFLLLKRIHPITGYGFVVFMAITGMLLVAAIAAGRRRSNRILQARGFVCDEKSSHKRLSRALAHYIGICSRLGSHRLLSADRKKAIFQGAHDLQQALDHHPLKDDLRRGIDVARERIIQPALGELNTINNKITASKARAVVEDYYLPYFPALAPWMVVYHQFTLVSEIADIYLPRPTLREYFTVVRDTWRIMREGNLLHHGQRYFASIEAANAPLGPAADELIQAMSIIWLTHCVSRTATVRCTTYHDWNARDSIEEIKNQLGNLMQSTHESIVQDALPFLKRRLHRLSLIHI